jgi:hypothetical protein
MGVPPDFRSCLFGVCRPPVRDEAVISTFRICLFDRRFRLFLRPGSSVFGRSPSGIACPAPAPKTRQLQDTLFFFLHKHKHKLLRGGVSRGPKCEVLLRKTSNLPLSEALAQCQGQTPTPRADPSIEGRPPRQGQTPPRADPRAKSRPRNIRHSAAAPSRVFYDASTRIKSA